MNTVSNYPVDAVIAWVDGGDENHQKKIMSFLSDKKIISNKHIIELPVFEYRLYFLV